MKTCPQCGHEWPDEFIACPLDGAQLIQKTSQAAGINLNLGDANAISGGIHLTDNHTVTNMTDSHDVITNNITNIVKSPEEIEAEKVKAAALAAKAKAEAAKAEAEAEAIRQKNERERLEHEHMVQERERKAREEADKRERERKEKEIQAKAREEAERLERERKEQERIRKAKEEADRKERERREKERAEKEWRNQMKLAIEANYEEFSPFNPNRLLEGDLVIPDSVTQIGAHAFDSSRIGRINVPSSVQRIGEYAFAHSGLNMIAISDSVQEIGRGAFESCFYLQQIIIPAGTRQHFEKMEGLDGLQYKIVEY